MASYPHCTCGIIKNQHKEFTARYQFKSSSDRIKIMPQSGVLNNNELIEVNFMFKPRLSKSVIFEEGLRLKMNVEERETKNEKVNKQTKKGIFINAVIECNFHVKSKIIKIKILLQKQKGIKGRKKKKRERSPMSTN